MKITNIILIIFVITLGCKDEFLLETKNYEPIMVVDGLITNEDGPYTIKISLSSPINTFEKFPYEGCTVTIYKNTDNSEVLEEAEPGIYVTSEGGIQGVIGNEYSISITTPEGKEYKTEFQEMKESVEIDSVYAELIYLKEEDYPFGLPGYQFYVNTETTQNPENYFLWNMIETYEYAADYSLHAVMNWKGQFLLEGIDTCTYFNNVYWCWKTQNTGYLFTGKTSNLTVPKISNQPLNFVGTNSRRLQIRYSLLLRQYSIGKETYYFWKSIEDQISQENFLVANQPYNITGNIKNIINPDEPVYGYFTVASVTQKRIFVTRPPSVSFYYEICFVCYDLEDPISIYYVISEEGRLGTVYEQCLDCTSRGGEIIKPDFWIDK